MKGFTWAWFDWLAIPVFPVVVAFSTDPHPAAVFIIGAAWMVAVTDTIRRYGGRA